MRGVRKLACVSIGYSLAVVLSAYLIPKGACYYFALGAALLSLLGLLCEGRKRLLVLLLGISFAVGLAYYGLHQARTVDICSELNGKTVKASMTVIEYPELSETYGAVTVRLCTEDLPHVKMKLYDYSGSLNNARPDDIIYAKVKLRNAAIRYGEESDSYISDGIYLIGNTSTDCELISLDKASIKYLPLRLARIFKASIQAAFPDDTQGFMLALLIGDKSEYYDNDSMYTSMSIAGLSHVVAVSGMHVSFILALFQLVLGRSRRVSAFSLIFIWIFVLMSGASPSAVRAGIMLTVYLLAPIFSRETDRITTLSFALLLILLINPFAALSLSLQLSFAAMAGIFCLTQPIYSFVNDHTPELRRLRRIKEYVNAALSNSISATVFTLPILAVRFGAVALLSPAANIFCLWAVSFLFVGGYIACFISLVWAGLGAFLGAVLSYLVRYISLVSGYIAGLPFAQLYTENTYSMLWIALCYILFAGFILVRRRKIRIRLILPLSLSLVSLVSVFVITDMSMRQSSGKIDILDVGSGQCIALTKGTETAVIDCGSSGKTINAGTELANLLHSEGRRSIDYFILTHIHSDHANAAVRLMGLMDVKTLVLPDDTESADDDLLNEILSAAWRYGVKIMRISKDTVLRAGSMELELYAPYSEGDKNERAIMLRARLGEKTLLVTADASQSTEKKLVNDKELSDTDILIVGHHGSENSTSQELLDEARPKTAVISVGYNTYGHPSEDVIYKLLYFGAEVYRTDQNGKIRILCGD